MRTQPISRSRRHRRPSGPVLLPGEAPHATGAADDSDSGSASSGSDSDAADDVCRAEAPSPRAPAIHYTFSDMRGRWSFLADNEFIVNGYRASLSWTQCFKSVFQLHNETVNVWTHLLGAVTFIYLGFYWGLFHLPVHYSQSSCHALPLMQGGMHTSHMVDLQLFPPYGVVGGPCKDECQPIPTLEWVTGSIREQYGGIADLGAGMMGAVHGVEHSVIDAVHGLEHSVAHMARELRSVQHQASASAGKRLGRLRSSVAKQLARVSTSMANLPAGASDRVRTGLSAAHSALTDLSAAVAKASHTMEFVRFSQPLPKWPVLVFLLSAFTCLVLSTIFHWFHVLSKDAFSLLSKLDYVGIAVLIAGSSVPPMYYGFCNPWLRWGYITMLTTICSGCIVVSLFDRFSSADYRTLRMSLYVGAGLSGGVPTLHMYFFTDMSNTGSMDDLLWRVCLMGMLYVGGALLYAARFPERFFPGKFDYLFSSHQIFHIMVFTAAVVHYGSVTNHYQMRSSTRCLV